ncbi:Alpha/Beta hydrolase protein [Coniochaeta sp. 2T2.1]|nr:Alpha/Beta hydrolase protein [Coniochaeta sp. 2T2.1]
MAVTGAYARYAEQDQPGLYLVYPQDERVTCTCDVFVIHGLHGGATKTWKHPESGNIWFRDMLPGLIRSEAHGASARIWTYGYPANVAFQTSSIYDFAQALLNRVKDVRKDNNQDRKIVWICHSLGGLVLKQALIEAKIHPRFSSISAATAGIVFMGTPHHGSGMADLGTIVSMVVASAVPGSRIFNRDILKDLKKNNNTLFGISSQFSNICSGMTIHSFHETIPLGPTIIVDKTSAIMHLENEQKRYGLYANHREMCRFRDGLDQNWLSVGSSVVELVSLSAPARARGKLLLLVGKLLLIWHCRES